MELVTVCYRIPLLQSNLPHQSCVFREFVAVAHNNDANNNYDIRHFVHYRIRQRHHVTQLNYRVTFRVHTTLASTQYLKQSPPFCSVIEFVNNSSKHIRHCGLQLLLEVHSRRLHIRFSFIATQQIGDYLEQIMIVTMATVNLGFIRRCCKFIAKKLRPDVRRVVIEFTVLL